MLHSYPSSYPIYFGCRYKPFVDQGFMSGGAGYVLSKTALRKLIEEGVSDNSKCSQDGTGPEDVEIGRCLSMLGIIAGDSRDTEKRGRFFPFGPEAHLFPNRKANDWYWKYVYYEPKEVRIPKL